MFLWPPRRRVSKGSGGTNVQTTEGTVAIDGTLSCLRDSRLVIQRSTKRGIELCVAGQQESCVALRSLDRAFAADSRFRARDQLFAHGISAYSLRIWLMFGFLLAFAGLLAASAEIMDNHPELTRR